MSIKKIQGHAGTGTPT